MKGAPNPLVSSFKLSYYTLLNLLRRMEGTGRDMEFVIRNSFQQFQFEQSIPVVYPMYKPFSCQGLVGQRQVDPTLFYTLRSLAAVELFTV